MKAPESFLLDRKMAFRPDYVDSVGRKDSKQRKMKAARPGVHRPAKETPGGNLLHREPGRR
ncbi:MAG: hypothetical protein CMJ62_03280 [Planctomycetaceae bacterium]|nr:hypothetical protein [Planctomycetaceae bacterium]